MLPGMELMSCPLAVPASVMHHVVRVESSYNPYAIGVVGGRLARQPRSLAEALATVRMLESRGYNFSLGLAQVNRYNLSKYGLGSYEQAFQTCPNLTAGSRILAECHGRSGGDWGKSFSCYYSGNFTTGFRHGYVQKIYASMRRGMALAATGGAFSNPHMQQAGTRQSVPVWTAAATPQPSARTVARIAAMAVPVPTALSAPAVQTANPATLPPVAAVAPLPMRGPAVAAVTAQPAADYGIAYPTHRPPTLAVGRQAAPGVAQPGPGPVQGGRADAFVF